MFMHIGTYAQKANIRFIICIKVCSKNTMVPENTLCQFRWYEAMYDRHDKVLAALLCDVHENIFVTKDNVYYRIL